MSWEKVRLSEICEINIGKTPSRNISSYWGGNNKWISISDLKGKRYIQDTKENITEQAVKESGIKAIPPNSLLYSFKLSIGKIAITKDYIYSNEAIASLPILDKTKVSLDYLYWAMQTLQLDGVGDKAVMGITLNKAKLKNLEIPLPPLPIQEKIAAILDNADALRRKDQELLKKYDELAQAIFIDMFGDPVRNEKGWEVKSVDQLVTKERHSIKRGPFGGALKKEIFVPSGYLVYEQYHALNNDFSKERYFVDEHKYKELIAFKVLPKDIIISCSGVYLGKLAVVPENAKAGIINQALLKITLNENIMKNDFFVFHFSQQNFKEKYFDANRGAGIPNFPPMSEFKRFPFICPPIQLQETFAKKIELINQLKGHTNAEKSEELFQSLLQRAFKGEI